MIPVDPAPDWHKIVITLYRHFGKYDALIEALSVRGCETQYSILWRLCSGRGCHPSWPTGAALLNLYAEVCK